MTAVTVRLEDKDKQELDAMCAEMGMSIEEYAEYTFNHCSPGHFNSED